MKKFLLATTLLAGFGAAGIALADDDDDDCRVPMANWQPREAVQQMAESRGWTVRRIKIDDGCYEIDGRDAKGRELEVKVDPATLAIVEMEYEDDDDDDDDDDRGERNNAAPAGTVAPPANGLFTPGTKPGVVVK